MQEESILKKVSLDIDKEKTNLIFSPVLIEFIKTLENPESTIPDLVKLISKDPFLVKSILKLANSAYYGNTKVINLERAAIILGKRELLKTAILIALHQDSNNNKIFPKEVLFATWRLTLWASVCAEIIARWTRLADPVDVYLATLLNDISLFDLYIKKPKLISQDSALNYFNPNEKNTEIIQIMQIHPELGKKIVLDLGLNNEIASAIANHHTSSENIHLLSPLCKVVCLSTTWANLVQTENTDPKQLINFKKLLSQELNLSAAETEKLHLECCANFKELLRQFDIVEVATDKRLYELSLTNLETYLTNSLALAKLEFGSNSFLNNINKQLEVNWGITNWQLTLLTRSKEEKFIKYAKKQGKISKEGPFTIPEIREKQKDKNLIRFPIIFNETLLGAFYVDRHSLNEDRFLEFVTYINFLSQSLWILYTQHINVDENISNLENVHNLKNIPLCMAFFDINGKVLEATSHFEELFGLSTKDKFTVYDLNKKIEASVIDIWEDLLFRPEIHKKEKATFLKLTETKNLPVIFSVERITNNNKHEMFVFLKELNQSHLEQFLALCPDITELRLSKKLLEEQQEMDKNLDMLTGLYNYNFFYALLAHEVEKFAKQDLENADTNYNQRLGLIFININNFAKINEELGHLAGNQILIKVALVLKKSIRESKDCPCRYEGDKFVIIVRSITIDGMFSLSARIHELLRAEFKSNISIRMGLSLIQKNETAKDFIKRIKIASDVPKYKGGNDIVWG